MDNSAFPQNQPKKQTQRSNDSILESLRSIGSGVGKTVAKDVTGKIANDALASLFGAPVKQQGELKANADINFGRERMPFPGFRRPEIRAREPYVAQTEIHLKEQIEAVRAELKALSASVKTLNTEIENAVRAELPAKPGVYHKNFLERIKSIIILIRQQIEDSRTWLALYTTRKKKIGYWGLYKKHGTQFGLSSERTLATSAG